MAKKSKKVEAEVMETQDFIPDTNPVVNADEDESLNIPSDVARERVKVLKDNIKDDYVELCKLLYVINRKQMYTSWGFGTFDEYVAKEMEFERSKARHLVQIWECLYEDQADKQVFNKVMQLGWTKASKLIHVINSENVDVWVEKGKYSSVENLSKDVKDYLNKKIPNDPKEALAMADEVEGTNTAKAIKKIPLQLQHDDYLAVSQAVERVQSMSPGTSFSQAVSLMARDFVGSAPEEMADPKATYVEYLKKYEKMSGLQLVIIDPDAKEILHGFDYLKSLTAEVGEIIEKQTSINEIEAEDAFN